jgi:hypothetical protein
MEYPGHGRSLDPLRPGTGRAPPEEPFAFRVHGERTRSGLLRGLSGDRRGLSGERLGLSGWIADASVAVSAAPGTLGGILPFSSAATIVTLWPGCRRMTMGLGL